MVALKMVVLLLFVVVGAFAVDSSNWTPFVPANEGDFGDFGASGVIRGAGVVFFAYVGFDAVSTAAGEARNPQRTVPIGLLADRADLDRALRRDRARADRHGALRPASTSPTRSPRRSRPRAAAPAGSTRRSTSRRSSACSRPCSSPSTARRASSCACRPTGCCRRSSTGSTSASRRRRSPRSCAASPAARSPALVPIDVLGELVSIGTLLAFMIVCAGVLVLRRTHPDLERPFRVPHVNARRGARAR